MVIIEDKEISKRGYVAPTVYLKEGKILPRYNYYYTFAQAADKWRYLMGTGGSNVSPAGDTEFLANGKAQTFGINVDFYGYQNGQWLPVSYAYLRSTSAWPPVIFRMYTTDGNGEYYAIFNRDYFGISATVVSNVSADKLAALDAMHREVQLLKYRYNSLISFLNLLAKRQLSAVEQQIFNEGILLSQNLNNEINSLSGIEVVYSKDGKIGIPVLLLIAIIFILAGTTAWTVAKIVTEKEKTKRINDAYELNKWVAGKKVEVSQLITSGQITQSQGNAIISDLDKTQAAALQNAKEAGKSQAGLFGNLAEIAKWGTIGLLGYLFFTSKKQVNG